MQRAAQPHALGEHHRKLAPDPPHVEPPGPQHDQRRHAGTEGVEHARLHERGRHREGQHGVLAPHLVAVGGGHAEAIRSRGQVSVVDHPHAAGVDPVPIEALEQVAEADAMGIGHRWRAKGNLDVRGPRRQVQRLAQHLRHGIGCQRLDGRRRIAPRPSEVVGVDDRHAGARDEPEPAVGGPHRRRAALRVRHARQSVRGGEVGAPGAIVGIGGHGFDLGALDSREAGSCPHPQRAVPVGRQRLHAADQPVPPREPDRAGGGDAHQPLVATHPHRIVGLVERQDATQRHRIDAERPALVAYGHRAVGRPEPQASGGIDEGRKRRAGESVREAVDLTHAFRAPFEDVQPEITQPQAVLATDDAHDPLSRVGRPGEDRGKATAIEMRQPALGRQPHAVDTVTLQREHERARQSVGLGVVAPSRRRKSGEARGRSHPHAAVGRRRDGARNRQVADGRHAMRGQALQARQGSQPDVAVAVFVHRLHGVADEPFVDRGRAPRPLALAVTVQAPEALPQRPHPEVTAPVVQQGRAPPATRRRPAPRPRACGSPW